MTLRKAEFGDPFVEFHSTVCRMLNTPRSNVSLSTPKSTVMSGRFHRHYFEALRC